MDIFVTVLGYLAAACLIFVSIPTFFQVIKTKKTSHLNFKVLLIFELACLMFILSGTYKLFSNGSHDALWFFNLAVCLANYISFFITAPILFYKWKNSRKAKKLDLSEKSYEERNE